MFKFLHVYRIIYARNKNNSNFLNKVLAIILLRCYNFSIFISFSWEDAYGKV